MGSRWQQAETDEVAHLLPIATPNTKHLLPIGILTLAANTIGRFWCTWWRGAAGDCFFQFYLLQKNVRFPTLFRLSTPLVSSFSSFVFCVMKWNWIKNFNLNIGFEWFKLSTSEIKENFRVHSKIEFHIFYVQARKKGLKDLENIDIVSFKLLLLTLSSPQIRGQKRNVRKLLQ